MTDSLGSEKKAIDVELHENTAVFDDKARAADYKADAMEAENEEHAMTVMQAVRAYPMASFWAFVMSCCIVNPENLFIRA